MTLLTPSSLTRRNIRSLSQALAYRREGRFAADAPLAAEHAVIDVILVDAVAKAGRAHLEGHRVSIRQL